METAARKVPAKTIESRTKQLTDLGFTLNADQWVNGNLKVAHSNVEYAKAEFWKEVMEQVSKGLTTGAHSLPFTATEHIPVGTEVGPVVQLTFEQEVEQEVNHSIAKLDVNKEKAAQFKEQYSGLTISGLTDKDGLKAVEEAKKIVRKARTTLEAKRKEVKKYYLQVGRGIDEYADDVCAPILEVEAHLDRELAAYQQLKDAEDKRIADEAEAAGKQRVKDLIDAGMVFNGTWYAIGENITMDIVTIKGMSETDFGFLLEKVKAEKIKLEKEAAIARKAIRIERAKDLGMVVNDMETSFHYINEFANLRLPVDDIVSMDDADFNASIFDLRSAIDLSKQKKEEKAENERKALEKEKEDLRREKLQMRQQQCENAGMVFDSKTLSYSFVNKYGSYSVTGDFIATAENDVFKMEMASIGDNIVICKNNEAVAAKKEQEMQQIIQQRIAALTGMGLVRKGDFFFYPDENWDQLNKVSIEFVENSTPSLWDACFSDFQKYQSVFLKRQVDNAAEKEREMQAFEDRYQARKKELSEMGVLLVDGKFCISVRDKQWTEMISEREIRETLADNWGMVVANLVANIDHAQMEEKNRIQAIEDERQKLMPEIDRVLSYISSMASVRVPQIADPKLIEILSQFAIDYSAATDKLRRAIDARSK